MVHQLKGLLPGSCAQKQSNGPGMFMSPRTQHCRLPFRMSSTCCLHLVTKSLRLCSPSLRPFIFSIKPWWQKQVDHMPDHISCQKFFSGHRLKPLFTCATLAQHGLEVWNSRNLSQPWRWMTAGVHFAHLFLTSCVDLSETVRCFWVCAHRLVEHAL